MGKLAWVGVVGAILLVSSYGWRWMSAEKTEEHIITQAINAVNSNGFLENNFPPPHDLAEVYAFSPPFFAQTYGKTLTEQLSDFVAESQGKVKSGLTAIYFGQGSRGDQAFEVRLDVCGDGFCNVNDRDIRSIDSKIARSFRLSVYPWHDKNARPDGFQRADISTENSLKNGFQVIAELRRNNMGEIGFLTLKLKRKAVGIESFMEQFKGNTKNSDFVSYDVFYHDYALGWSYGYE